jgi:hypothetical protein
MKKIAVTLSLLFLSFSEFVSQTYITVTSEASLISAISSANSLAQASTSQKVYIQLNASALIILTQNLPTISTANGNGTITIEKHPSASVDQGIEWGGGSGVTRGFFINNCQNTSAVVNINRLTVKGFQEVTHTLRDGILLTSCENTVCINTSKFTENYYGIRNEKTRHLYVDNNCEFFNNQHSGFYEKTKTTVNPVYSSETRVQNCHFYATSGFNAQCPYMKGWFGVYIEGLYNGMPASYMHLCAIQNNLIENTLIGVRYGNDEFYNASDPTFSPYILNNTIQDNETNVVLFRPSKNAMVDGNTMKIFPYTAPSQVVVCNPPDWWSPGTNVVILSGTNQNMTPGLFGMDFIGPNTLGLPQKNNNTYYNSVSGPSGSPEIFLCEPQNHYVREMEINIVGQNLSGGIYYYDDRNTNIRECLLKGPGPIINSYGFVTNNPGGCGSNCLIQPPTLDYAYFPTSSSINVFFHLATLYGYGGSVLYSFTNGHGPYVVEFFKSNANGDLVSYLGSYTINQLSPSNSYSGIILNQGLLPGDKIAATITSLGTNTNPQDPQGTSVVAYFIIPTSCNISVSNGAVCPGAPVNLGMNCPSATSIQWYFGDGAIASGPNQIHSYQTPGNYQVNCFVTVPNLGVPLTFNTSIQAMANCPVACQSCIGSFAPDPGDYIVSLWVKEDNTNSSPPPVNTYANTGIKVTFSPPTGGAPITTIYQEFGKIENPIIDGWQRIETKINIPAAAAQISIELLNNNSSGIDSYFDDIRIHPVDANMKSYVYDPINLRLVAEMDENNYGTFYEYDEEGNLVRVKKETEKGIMTIKENRSSNKKR